jgi:hypothetical protein
VAYGVDAAVYDVQAGSGEPILNDVVRQTDHDQLAPRCSPVLAAGEPGNRRVKIILATFTGTIPVNVDSVAHGAQVAGLRVTRQIPSGAADDGVDSVTA